MEAITKIDLESVYKALTKSINRSELSNDELTILHRFRDKLTSSVEFSKLVNKDFNGMVMSKSYSNISTILRSGNNLELDNNFKLIYKGGYWDLYKDNELFLDKLDFKISKKIALDINVAFLIYNKRLTKYNE